MRNEEPNLEVTLEQLARMYRALANLDKKRGVYNEGWHALMAEGPLEEIRRLEAEVARLSGRTDAERAVQVAVADIWLSIRGPAIEWPHAPASVLTSFLDTLRKGVQVVAERLATGDVSARPTKALIEACDLRVVALEPGSLRVGLELPLAAGAEDALSPEADASRRALDAYVTVASWAAGEEPDAEVAARFPDSELRYLVLTQVKRLVPRPRGSVEEVELTARSLPRLRPARLVKATHERIDRAMQSEHDGAVETYEGDLREIDLDGRTFTLRNISGQSSSMQVGCTYEASLDETAFEAINRRVEVVGLRPGSAVAARRPAAKLRVHRLVILNRSGLD